MNFPGDLKYSESHEWVRLEGETAVIGITDFAQDQLGDVTFVELPEVGATLIEGSEMGSVESVKAASDLFAPVSGKVLEVNQTLQASPEILNSDPYDQGWMLKVQLSAKPTTLISAEEYQKLL